MPNPSVEFLSITKGITRPHTVDNSIIAQNRNIDFLPPKELTMHAHPYFSLLYIVDSENFTSLLNGYEIRALRNQMFLQPPNTLHTPTNQFTGSRNGISLRFNINDAELIEKIGNLPSFITCDEKIKAHIFKLSEFENIEFTQSQLNIALAELLDMFLNSPTLKIIPQKSSEKDNSDFINLIKYMYTNFDQAITLAGMAKLVHMEPTYFAKKFKASYNIPPMNYLYSVRLFRSLDILMYTNSSIASIAEKVGFKSVAAFCTAFRRAYGLSPSDYRKQAQKMKFDAVIQ